MHSDAGDSPALERSRRFGAVVEAAYCNIAETVLLCSVPEVQVTVMVLVLGIKFEIPAEQPVKTPCSPGLQRAEVSSARCGAFSGQANRARHTMAPGNSGMRSLLTLAIAPGCTRTVSVDIPAVVAVSITLAGDKQQAAPTGQPARPGLTLEENPY
jgi:hypothetical protein